MLGMSTDSPATLETRPLLWRTPRGAEAEPVAAAVRDAERPVKRSDRHSPRVPGWDGRVPSDWSEPAVAAKTGRRKTMSDTLSQLLPSAVGVAISPLLIIAV